MLYCLVFSRCVRQSGIILFWVLTDVLLREYKSQQQLAKAREQLRQYALKAEDRATVHERNRIAREIHDSVGHVLTAQAIQLSNAIAFWQSDPPKAHQFLIESRESVRTALKDIRHSVSTLRSDPLQGKKLEKAIAWLPDTSMPILYFSWELIFVCTVNQCFKAIALSRNSFLVQKVKSIQ